MGLQARVTTRAQLAAAARSAAPSRRDARDGEARAERALRVVYGSVLPRMARGAEAIPGVLGYSRPSMARLCVRNHEFYAAMARQLDVRVELLLDELESTAVSESWRRVERGHLEDAAVELLGVVRGFPRPVRDVVELRAAGVSWRDVTRALPDRVYWSMTDDWAWALRKVWGEHDGLVGRIV